jgi:Prokaryotic homologs of the JAB domain
MDSEDDLFRPPPRFLFCPSGLQLRVPTGGLTATLALLRAAGQRESGVFWYGPRDPLGNGTVSYVVAPEQRMSWGNYHVLPQALAAVVHRLGDGWKPLAQIHSHPGRRVEHSDYDDRMMSSRKALSLVFPSHGVWSGSFPRGVGVHEYQGDYWHLLPDDVAGQRVTLVLGEVKVEDLRWKTC